MKTLDPPFFQKESWLFAPEFSVNFFLKNELKELDFEHPRSDPVIPNPVIPNQGLTISINTDPGT